MTQTAMGKQDGVRRLLEDRDALVAALREIAFDENCDIVKAIALAKATLAKVQP